jgi:hypothetical protein
VNNPRTAPITANPVLIVQFMETAKKLINQEEINHTNIVAIIAEL